MNKDKKITEVPSRDPVFTDEAFTYNNMLALPDNLKSYLTEKGLDWRFLNAREYRGAGNYHRSHWQPLKVTEEMGKLGLMSTTAEGLIQRGDLILGVRTKAVTAKHKEFLRERNRRYSNFAQTEARKLREDVARKGMSEHVKVSEGYDDDEKGFK